MIVKPFAAVRPTASVADRVAALPYDVYDRAEAVAAVDGEPLSFLNIDRPETQFSADADMYAPEVYAKALRRSPRRWHIRYRACAVFLSV